MKRRAGTLLLQTLTVLFLLTVLAAAMFQRYGIYGRRVTQVLDRYSARAAADSGIADALYGLQQDPDWTDGCNDLPLSTGARYRVSFAPDRPDVPPSTNNASGTEAVEGEGGRIVPAGFVHVISVGTCAGVSVRREALFDLGSGAPRVKEHW